MGIRGLKGWIKWAASNTIKAPIWENYKNKRIGIDILGFIYKAKASKINPILYIAQLIAQCRNYNMIPIPIFDGKIPDEKRDTIRLRSEIKKKSNVRRRQLINDIDNVTINDEQRRILTKELDLVTLSAIYVTTDERDEVKKFLYAAGVFFMNANGEADNLLAYMARKGDIDAVITYDMDLLTRGVSNLLVPKGLSLLFNNNDWISYNLNLILKKAGIVYSQFLEMCILMGCDYTDHKISLRFVEAYNFIKYKGNLNSYLKFMNIDDTIPYEKARNILKGEYDDINDLVNEKQLVKWANWIKGDKETGLIEESYLEDLRAEVLKSMNDNDFQILHRSDALIA